MTEKRFAVTQTVLGSGIYDYQAENELCESYDEDAYMEVCKKLNALHEENQALKKKIDIMADVFLQSNDLIEIEQVFYTKVCEPSEHFNEETLSMITNSLLGSDVE